MIDISQIVSNAASAASSRSASNTSNASNADAKSQGFGDALARARNDDRSSSSTNANINSAPARNDASGQNGNATAPGAQAGTVAAKPARRQDKEDEQSQDQAADPAAQSAAAALAALLAPQPAQPAQPALPAALAANGTLPGSAGLPGTAALGAQAGLKDPALATATAAAAATVDAAAPAGSAAADTLATIASQRAALQPGTQATASTQAASTDKAAAPAPAADAAKAAPDLAASLKAAMAGQQGGNGQASSGQQDASLGQPYKAPLQLGDAGKNNPLPATTAAAAPANPMQLAAAMRAAEPASTEATPAAVTPLMAAGTLAASQAPTSGGLSPTTSLPIAPPVGDGQWPQALGQQMVRLSTQGNHTAELQLNPPDLGPLKVVLNVVNDQAQAQFVSPHAAVRAAVEAALPQLRTALADSGIQLGQTSVGADSFAGQAGNGQQQQRQPGNAQNGFGTLAGMQAAPVNAGPTAPVARTLARGEVDTFA